MLVADFTNGVQDVERAVFLLLEKLLLPLPKTDNAWKVERGLISAVSELLLGTGNSLSLPVPRDQSIVECLKTIADSDPGRYSQGTVGVAVRLLGLIDAGRSARQAQ